MDDPLISKAIQSALNQNWLEAIRFNLELIKVNSEDVETLNRLAFAYLKSGDILNAKAHYQKVLRIDKFNPIANKNLKWLNRITQSDIHQNPAVISPPPTVFLEEPGKTKIVLLVNLAPVKVLCNLLVAQEVKLLPKKHSIEVRDNLDGYIGALPDDVSYKLLKFFTGGNTYTAYIKGVTQNSVSIFIRELSRSQKFNNLPSFPVFASGNHQVTEVKQSESENSPAATYNLSDTEN